MAAKEGSFERKKQEGWLGLWNHPPFREICLRRRGGEEEEASRQLKERGIEGGNALSLDSGAIFKECL